ncbi:putative RAD54-DNA-dependent ATPase of the Snf2p family [Hysterangium stoloniferum]|nr:putative RAD54-DNA-dependent ATPase of the Snf2p family [Hysterangium stoloniferum]
MLRRAPATEDGFVVDRLQESVRVNRPFKALHAPRSSTMFFPGGNGNMYQMRTKAGGVVPIVLTNASLGVRAPTSIPPRPLHDPMQDHAIVLRVKEEERVNAIKEAQEKNKGLFNPHKNLRSLFGERQQKNQKQSKVPVVIDPRLSKVLRPHQVEGVKFLYRCTTGMLVDNQYGCIMADEIGLGKTLQCIALFLVRNWANEFSESINPTAAITHTVPSLALDGKGTKAEMIERVQGWASASGRTVTLLVLIVSYETLRTLQPYLVNVEVGLLLCDEGHCLKNGVSDSLAFTALTSLNVKRRVILSGTPIQDKQKWQEKLQEMSGLVTKFRIQRTNDLFEQTSYLTIFSPCQVRTCEHVVFCGLSELQLSLYLPLKPINLLKKLCNHPELLDLPGDLKGSDKLIPPDFSGPNDKAISRGGSRSGPGRGFVVLERVLHSIKTETKDKIVLISNYTQTLDLYGYVRLDGGMAITKRQKYVDQFNGPERSEFVFLLSSKAGGCGINLIGANRLILFDPDWNPAADQQALAQKVFPRQASKRALSSCVVDDKQDAERHFSVDDLRKLSLFKEKTLCETHDTCKCKRCKDGKQIIKAPALLYGDASTWNHFTNSELKNNHDDLLRAEAGLREISFVFQDISH